MTSSMTFVAALAAAFLMWSAVARAQDSQPTAESILSRYEAGLGDAAALAKIKSLRLKGKLAMGAGGGMAFEERYLGEKTLFLMNYGKTLMPVQGSTGAWTWTSDAAMGVMIKEGLEQGAVKRIHAIQRLAPWKSVYVGAALVGMKKLGEADAYELKMTGDDQQADVWWIDAATHRLAKVDVVYPDFSGGELKMSWRLEDWKTTDGIAYPMKRIQEVAKMKLPYVIESVEWNAALAPLDVQPPERVQKAFDDPKRKAAAANKDEIKVEDVTAQPIASIRVTIKPEDISKTLSILYGEIGAYMQRSGAEFAGPPFSRYHGEKDGMLDFEAGIPISKPLAGEGRVKGGELPAGKVATTVHVGKYEDLKTTHDKLTAWMAAKKLESAGALWESYLTDPGLEPDPKKWRTKVCHPVK